MLGKGAEGAELGVEAETIERKQGNEHDFPDK